MPSKQREVGNSPSPSRNHFSATAMTPPVPLVVPRLKLIQRQSEDTFISAKIRFSHGGLASLLTPITPPKAWVPMRASEMVLPFIVPSCARHQQRPTVGLATVNACRLRSL